jgi:vacuolar-type H+-ATPase subunit H
MWPSRQLHQRRPQKDHPAEHQDRELLGPAERRIEDVAAEHLEQSRERGQRDDDREQSFERAIERRAAAPRGKDAAPSACGAVPAHEPA